MARSVVVAVAALFLIGLTTTSVHGQDKVLGELYGRGVHAYYDGDYQFAHELLSEAIEQGCQDPRCFYFRGFAFAKLGRPDEAKADYQKGAKIEAAANRNQWPVARSLERVQGPQRLTLEKERQKARLNVVKAERLRRARRYGALLDAEQVVLRDLDRKLPEGLPKTPAVAKDDPKNPFQAGKLSGQPASGEAAVVQTPMPAGNAAAANNPFGKKDDAATTNTPAVASGTPPATPANPFGGGAAKPAANTPANPFGGGAAKPAANTPANPFGGGGAAKPAANTPANPFGGDAAKPAANTPANPFGGGAAKPAQANVPQPAKGADTPPANVPPKPAAAADGKAGMKGLMKAFTRVIKGGGDEGKAPGGNIIPPAPKAPAPAPANNTPPAPANNTPPAKQPAAPANPFGADAAKKAAPANPFGADTKKAEPKKAAPANPFGAEAAPKKTAPPANPFGADAAKKAAPKKAAPANPFGADAAKKAAPKKAAPANPFGADAAKKAAPKKAAPANPFGADAAKKAAPKKAAPANPFGN